MKKSSLVVTLFLVCAIFLSACTNSSSSTGSSATVSAPTATSSTLTLTDGLNRSVTLNSPAKRIVSLAPSMTEMLFAIGAGSQVVGRDSFSNYPEQATSIAEVGGSSGDYSYETITSLKPDLVIAAEINTADQVKKLEDLGLKVYYFANPVDFNDLFNEMETLGKLTGHESDAKTAVDALTKRVSAVTSTVAKATSTPTVFYELDGSDPSNPWTPGPGSFMDQLITAAGGKNAAATLSSQWAQISIENLLIVNPDYIVLGDSNYGVTPEQVAARTGWDQLTAVKDSKVYAFNDDLVSRAGPRMVDGLEALAKLIHPELFK